MSATKFTEFFPLTDEGIYGQTENYETHEQAREEIAEWTVVEGWTVERTDEGDYLVDEGVRIYALLDASE